MASHGSHTWQESRKGNKRNGRLRWEMERCEFWGRELTLWSPQWGTGSYIMFHRILKT